MEDKQQTDGLPTLMRQARKLAFREEFAEAAALYAQIMVHPDIFDVFDVRVRYAVCLEESGDFAAAVEQFTYIIEAYSEMGEASAAEGAAVTLETLKQKLKEDVQRKKKQELAETPVRHEDLMRIFAEIGDTIKYMPDEYICEHGELSNKIWLLTQGVLTIVSEEKRIAPEEVYTLSQEHVLLGERGFFTKQRRDVSVRAKTYVEVIEISASSIQAMAADNPAFAVAVERLMRTTWVEPALARQDVFKRMHEMDRIRMAMTFSRVQLNPSEVLFEEGADVDGAYLLQSGCLFSLFASDEVTGFLDNGMQMVSAFPGDMIHLPGLINGYKSRYKVVAATPVKLLHLNKKRFASFAEQRPWLLQAIMQHARQPARLQVMGADDNYLWRKERHLEGIRSF